MSHNQRFEAVVAKQVGNPAVQEEVLALYAAALARADQAERERDAARVEAANAWRLVNGSADSNLVVAGVSITAVVELGAKLAAVTAERDDYEAIFKRIAETLLREHYLAGSTEGSIYRLITMRASMAAERDEWKQRAEVADAELLRMHDAVGGLASGLPKHIAALVAERDALAAELAAVREALEHIIADMPDHLVHPQAVCDAIRQAIARTPSAP